MSYVRVWITFTALFVATCYCYTVKFNSRATERQILRSHAAEAEENFHHAQNNGRQPADDDPNLTLCGYHVCLLDEKIQKPVLLSLNSPELLIFFTFG